MNSYTPGSGEPIDRARFMLGDTGSDGTWLLSQDEILDLISAFGFREGVAQCADALLLRFSNEPDSYSDEGGVKAEWRSRFEAWARLANNLRSNTSAPQGGSYAAGQIKGPDMTGLRP